jgi:hypothetical protein
MNSYSYDMPGSNVFPIISLGVCDQEFRLSVLCVILVLTYGTDFVFISMRLGARQHNGDMVQVISRDGANSMARVECFVHLQ